MTDDADHTNEPEPADGYCLREAVERFADPDKVRADAEAKQALQGYPAQRSSWPDRVPDDGWLSRRSRGDWLGERLPGARPRSYGHPSQPVSYGEACRRRDRAWQAVLDDFRGRLLSGELIASGYEPPRKVTDERIDIPAERWRVLRPRFKDSSARGGSLDVICVRVRRADQAPRDTGAMRGAEPVPDHGEAAAASGAVRTRPGRASFVREAEEELRAMAAGRELRGNLKADSAVIAERVKQRIADRNKTLSPKTVSNRLHRLYWQLWEEQKARI